MTKWKILNGIAFIVLWSAIVTSYYGFLYPAPFAPASLVQQVEWKSFLLLYFALLLLAFTFSLIGSGLYAFQKSFLKILLTLHIVAIMSIGIVAGITLYNKRSGLKELLSDTKQQAARDIRADAIYYISYGLPHPDSNYFKRDSIMAKYGIHHTSTCIID
ncbi:hypothetical protein U0035_05240 [Niabella yanshanensis]|uniref:Tetraspanin family protein n=1 Tax=Niabella yanshanensis TaxID=577386 RepID=A0ABZ0W9C0_9BACT|nr:hypothetical protein [Niabella yanshanensis]WQD39549.1 hypothetical protein U0035_05240 [Niabella yanshanensis]